MTEGGLTMSDDTKAAAPTAREVLRLIWEADRYL